MPQVLPMTRVEAYLAYKAGVISEADLKPSLKTNFYSGLEHWLAYWCGLCDDYPVDENNDPKWYTEEEYYVAYLCGIAPDYPVNCYRRVGAYLRYIISARWDKPEKPLTREEYYLSLMPTTYLPPNDPASIITLDNTAEAPFGDLKIYGDSFQQTYTGKNLVKVTATSQTIGSITFTVNNDGTVVVNGTNGNSVVALNLIGNDPIVLPAGQYENSGCPDGGSNDTYRLDINNGTNANQTCYGTPKIFTLTSELTITNYRIRIAANAVINNLVFKPMIRSTSTGDSTFEPYTGSTPSQITPAPNPDYPQDINVVTGEQTVKVTGKNLFDKSDSTLVFNGYLATGTITLTNSPNDRTVFIPCQPNTEYTIQKMFSSLDKNRFRIASFATLPVNGAVGTNLGGYSQTQANTHNAATYTTSADAKYLVVFCYTDDTNVSFSQMLDSIQIELGSTASDYVPYQGQSYNIDLSKNLYSIADGTYTSNGVEAVVSNGVVTVNRTSSSDAVSVIRIPLAASFTAKNGDTLVIEAGNDQAIGATNNQSAYMCLRLKISGGPDDTSTDCYLGAKNAVMHKTMDADKEYDTFVIRTATSLSPSNLVLRPKIYVNPIELCKIGDYQDYLWTDGEKWYKHAALAKAIFDGDEEWSISNSGTDNFYYALIAATPGGPTSDYYRDLLSNYGRGNKVYNTNTIEGIFILASGLVRIRYGEEMATSDWKAKLAATPMVLYYPLATPTDEEITDAALVAQLNALLEGGSYNYQTNIVVSAADPNLPGLLQVTAAKWQ